MTVPWIAMMAGLGLVTPAHRAQEPPRWRADIRILELAASRRPRGLEVRIRVTSDFDDLAKGAWIEVLLPIGVGVLSVDPGCRPSQSPVPTVAARVSCDLGDIPVRGLREVNLLTTLPAGLGQPQVAAFVHSDTPDPNLANNFVRRVVR